MIKLLKGEGSDFIVYSLPLKIGAIGSQIDMRRVLHLQCGVEHEEIDWAFSEMVRKNDNVADFGINRMLTHTTKIPSRRPKYVL